MLLQLKRPGNILKQVDILNGDKVMVTIWDFGCFTGDVDAVTADYIALANLEQLDNLYPQSSTIFIKNPSIFYNEEIYCIVKLSEIEGGVA